MIWEITNKIYELRHIDDSKQFLMAANGLYVLITQIIVYEIADIVIRNIIK